MALFRSDLATARRFYLAWFLLLRLRLFSSLRPMYKLFWLRKSSVVSHGESSKLLQLLMRLRFVPSLSEATSQPTSTFAGDWAKKSALVLFTPCWIAKMNGRIAFLTVCNGSGHCLSSLVFTLLPSRLGGLSEGARRQRPSDHWND